MFVLWLAVVVLVSDPSSAVTCNNGGAPFNSTSCNCTGTCFSGTTCETHDTCGEAPTLSNSHWMWTPSGGGCDGVLTYTCDVGYTISNTNNSGNITVTCSGSSWSTPQVSCTRVSCPTPVAGHNARVLGLQDHNPLGYFYTDKVALECLDFTRGKEGHIRRTCQADGTWSGRPLVCRVSITSAIVVGLTVALWCLALAIILPYDFFTYMRRQRRIKELRSHTYRIGQASMRNTPALWTPRSVTDQGVDTSKKRRASRGNEPSLFLSTEQKQLFYDRLSKAKMDMVSEEERLSGSSIGSGEFSDMDDVGMGDSVEMLVNPKSYGRDKERAYLGQESDDGIAESAH